MDGDGYRGPEVFVRKSSGLVRVMSPSSAFVYNVLTMGLIFPWIYLWAPGALPGGQLVWGILLAMVLEIPIALAYVWLSTAFPRTGGDYVFQSRVSAEGSRSRSSSPGSSIWILQWVALSGWLLATSVRAAVPRTRGVDWESRPSRLAAWFTSPDGIIVMSILNALLALAHPCVRAPQLHPPAVGDVVRDPPGVRDDARRPFTRTRRRARPSSTPSARPIGGSATFSADAIAAARPPGST